jgi:hypothetical protein
MERTMMTKTARIPETILRNVRMIEDPLPGKIPQDRSYNGYTAGKMLVN